MGILTEEPTFLTLGCRFDRRFAAPGLGRNRPAASRGGYGEVFCVAGWRTRG